MAKRKIVDAHHHLWDLGRGYNYPWLQDKPSGEGMLGNLAADRARLPPPGLSRRHRELRPGRLGAHRGRAGRPVIETRWLQETTDSEGLPSAIVARVELQKPDAERVDRRAL